MCDLKKSMPQFIHLKKGKIIAMAVFLESGGDGERGAHVGAPRAQGNPQ